MVTEFGTSGGYTNSTITTNSIRQRIGVGNGVSTMFESRLRNRPVPGSLTIIAGAYLFSDDVGNSSEGTANLRVNVSDGTKGTINYATAQYSLLFSYPLASRTTINASYLYISEEISSGTGQGNHGSPIYSFTIYQQGSTLILIDSNGNRYDGELGSVRVTGGNPPTDPITAENTEIQNGPVVAQFTASGTANGYNISIVGTLQGNRDGAVFKDRTVTGTYIEQGGYQADLNGVATAVQISG